MIDCCEASEVGEIIAAAWKTVTALLIAEPWRMLFIDQVDTCIAHPLESFVIMRMFTASLCWSLDEKYTILTDNARLLMTRFHSIECFRSPTGATLHMPRLFAQPLSSVAVLPP